MKYNNQRYSIKNIRERMNKDETVNNMTEYSLSIFLGILIAITILQWL